MIATAEKKKRDENDAPFGDTIGESGGGGGDGGRGELLVRRSENEVMDKFSTNRVKIVKFKVSNAVSLHYGSECDVVQTQHFNSYSSCASNFWKSKPQLSPPRADLFSIFLHLFRHSFSPQPFFELHPAALLRSPPRSSSEVSLKFSIPLKFAVLFRFEVVIEGESRSQTVNARWIFSEATKAGSLQKMMVNLEKLAELQALYLQVKEIFPAAPPPPPPYYWSVTII
ncbi:hypothetical protein LguiA_021431 [Lonicera macranthoides]